ncbi:MAG: N-acetyltransferase GCN5 [Marinobacter sp. T13-3]|nr:MAG: N-acetyltransferase GCN5 [Marinobacter sp. T13-3]
MTSQLRPMDENDLELVLSWRNHPDIRRFMYTTHEISLAEHKRWFAGAKEKSETYLRIYEQDGKPTGFVNVSLTRCPHVADWGFYVAPDASKGTGRRMGEAALAFVFQELGLHKLCGQALGFNGGSVGFHKKLGFAEEGRLRDQHFDGEHYHDVVCFGLLASEWQPNEVKE